MWTAETPTPCGDSLWCRCTSEGIYRWQSSRALLGLGPRLTNPCVQTTREGLGPPPTTRECRPSRDHACPARHNAIIESYRATQEAHGGVLGKECVRGSRGPVSNSGDHRRQLRGQVERRERGASSTRAARRGGRHIPQGPNPIASAGWPTYRKRLAQWSPHSGDGKKNPGSKR